MNEKSATRFSVIIVTVGILLFTGCGVDRAPITIGTNAWPPCEVWYVAEAAGLLDDIPAEIVRFSSWTDNMNSMYRGTTDIAHATYFNSVYYSDKGDPARIFLISDSVDGSDGVTVRNGVSSLHDLVGRKVAVEVNTDAHFLMAKALELAGGTINDVTIVGATGSEAVDLFAAGEVDAVAGYEPFLSMAAEKGGYVAWTTQSLPGYMVDVISVSQQTLDTRKRDLEKLVDVWYQAHELIKSDPGRYMPIMAKQSGMDVADFEPFFNSFTFYSRAEVARTMDSTTLNSRLDEMGAFLVEQRAIGEAPRSENLYTGELLR